MASGGVIRASRGGVVAGVMISPEGKVVDVAPILRSLRLPPTVRDVWETLAAQRYRLEWVSDDA